MIMWICALIAFLCLCLSSAYGQTLFIAYIGQERADLRPATANIEPLPQDLGLRGAELGIEDNNTTGRFTNQSFRLLGAVVKQDEDPARAFYFLRQEGVRHILVNLPAAKLLALADSPEAKDSLLYNVGAYDDRLRGKDCRANVLHTLPSHAMRADAIGQYLKKKRWEKWFLVPGPWPQDQLFAEALKRSAKRFGLKIVAAKPWTHTYDARRTAESEVAVFTQGVDYDVVLVADEADLFGAYFPYRTWLPRPVAGSHGLAATAWHPAHEQWGAVQLQNRFRKLAGRRMQPEDYAAWLAVRAIGEAATRTQSTDFTPIREYLLSDQLALPGFKGVPLSFRPWDGQLRQPILLASAYDIVAVAPIEGFLHPTNELDTLGYDARETECHLKR
ncbi:MAG: ABC transporter substrate-binding protein [Methylohalobius sp.]|nr:ABC transporter substrate-binding protein [Methylohalobius sp.]